MDIVAVRKPRVLSHLLPSLSLGLRILSCSGTSHTLWQHGAHVLKPRQCSAVSMAVASALGLLAWLLLTLVRLRCGALIQKHLPYRKEARRASQVLTAHTPLAGELSRQRISTLRRCSVHTWKTKAFPSLDRLPRPGRSPGGLGLRPHKQGSLGFP